MLYTFSQAHYAEKVLLRYLANIQQDDVIVLWQDGVLLALKYPRWFAKAYLLEADVIARNFTALLAPKGDFTFLSMAQFIGLTEKHFPQLAL